MDRAITKNKNDVAIYEIVAERPTKLRIKKAVFVLKRNLEQTPEEIVSITKAWLDLIDFKQTSLLNATKTNHSKTIKQIGHENDNDRYTKYYSREISRIPVALAAGGMRKLNNPCYNIIHTETINTFV